MVPSTQNFCSVFPPSFIIFIFCFYTTLCSFQAWRVQLLGIFPFKLKQNPEQKNPSPLICLKRRNSWVAASSIHVDTQPAINLGIGWCSSTTFRMVVLSCPCAFKQAFKIYVGLRWAVKGRMKRGYFWAEDGGGAWKDSCCVDTSDATKGKGKSSDSSSYWRDKVCGSYSHVFPHYLFLFL